MSNFTPFNFESHNVPVITDENGEPWFVAAEVCEVPGVRDTAHALTRIDDDEKRVAFSETPGGEREMTTFNGPSP